MYKHNINPYINEIDNSPLLLPSVIAYIDVLGYKDLIESDTSQYNLIFYRNALKWVYESLEQFSEYAVTNNIDLGGLKNEYEVRGFFDNFVIGYPVEGNPTKAVLEKIFSLLAHVQLRMILDGYFLRGAISIGDLHLDDAIVFGKGLLEAQEAEKNIACYPRIILTASAKQRAQQHSGQYQSCYLLSDTDKQFFLNYLEGTMEALPAGEPDYDTLRRHKESINKNLNSYLNCPKILGKYIWVANYHNYHCKKYQRYFADYMVDLGAYEISSIEQR